MALKTQETKLSHQVPPTSPPSSPQSTNVRKFDATDIDSIKTLQEKVDRTTYHLGQLYISEMKFNEGFKIQKEKLETTLKECTTEEKTLAEKLSDKYGKGSLNIENGEFTPVP